VEDETHFLVKGKNFENIKKKTYLETIYTLCPNLKTCNNENIFIWIMGCENPEALRTLSNLIIELTSEGFVFEKYMNMCADPENNALFNSVPLNKPSKSRATTNDRLQCTWTTSFSSVQYTYCISSASERKET
jgi:hypothetical protein